MDPPRHLLGEHGAPCAAALVPRPLGPLGARAGRGVVAEDPAAGVARVLRPGVAARLPVAAPLDLGGAVGHAPCAPAAAQVGPARPHRHGHLGRGVGQHGGGDDAERRPLGLRQARLSTFPRLEAKENSAPISSTHT